MGSPRPGKIQISEIFDFGGFEPEIIDFVKEFNRETAPSPKLKLLRSKNSILERDSFRMKFLYKINEFGLETSKIENFRNLDFSRPRAAQQVCVEKAGLFSTQTRPVDLCHYTSSATCLDFLKEIKARVLTHSPAPSLCRKSRAFSTQTWWAARGLEQNPDFGNF